MFSKKSFGPVKIISTIGPSSFSFRVLKNLKKNGASIARINTKYGNAKEWKKLIKNLKLLSFEIMIDIKGINAIPFANSVKFDYLAVSYANTATQIKKIRELIIDKKVKIISKIETKNGLKNADALIKSSDGLMIARGDLSRNVSFEMVPHYKRILLEKCQKENKFVIVATEMMLSMVTARKPTNAEVDDVFDSVMDGADAIMLSEETTIGKHPALVVKFMKKIKDNAEKCLREKHHKK
jgi:pyruvate kinase